MSIIGSVYVPPGYFSPIQTANKYSTLRVEVPLRNIYFAKLVCEPRLEGNSLAICFSIILKGSSDFSVSSKAQTLRFTIHKLRISPKLLYSAERKYLPSSFGNTCRGGGG